LINQSEHFSKFGFRASRWKKIKAKTGGLTVSRYSIRGVRHFSNKIFNHFQFYLSRTSGKWISVKTEPQKIKLVFVAFLLRTQHWRVRGQTGNSGWLHISIICQSNISTCILVKSSWKKSRMYSFIRIVKREYKTDHLPCRV
jgi:hypothetical protein